MDTSSFFDNFENLLFPAILASVYDIENEFHGESVYSLMLFPSVGFCNFSIAASSRERIASSPSSSETNAEIAELIKDHPDLLEIAFENEISRKYYLLTACEWDYFADSRFAQLNQFLDSNHEKIYDAGTSPAQIEDLFASSIVSTLKRIKSENRLKSGTFESDLFLGFQHPDTDNRTLMLDVSKAVNSDSWHKLALEEWTDA